jgi:LemA protein
MVVGRSFLRPAARHETQRRARREERIITLMRALIAVILVIVLVVGGAVVWGVGVNNQLVQSEQGVNETWAQVQNVYQRRADLIPNLVETVKGFAAQERTVLEEVVKARASATQITATPELVNNPAAMQKFQQAQGELGGALSRLLVTVERYPELKSNQNFLALQSQLEGTENRIAVERRRYNEAVRDYNTRLRLFPASLVASFRGFRDKAFFEAAPGSEAPPKVKF